MAEEPMFTQGEFEAARMFVACLSQHISHESFDSDTVGFHFSGISELPAGVTQDGTSVTTKDFIRSALKIMLGQLSNLEELSGNSQSDIVSRLGVAIAKEDPEDVDP